MYIQEKLKSLLILLQARSSASWIVLSTFIGLLTLTIALFWFAIIHSLEERLSQQTEVLGNSLATQASFNATQSILTNDLLSLNVLLNRLVADQNILSAHIYNKDDELLAEATSHVSQNHEISSNDKQKVFSAAIKFRQQNVGYVIITLDKTPSQETLAELGSLLSSIGIFIIAVSTILALAITRLLFAPINNANRVLVAINKGYKNTSLKGSFYKESQQLHDTIRKTQQLEQERDKAQDKDEKSELITKEPTKIEAQSKPQIEFNFDQFFEEDKKRNCILFIELDNMHSWKEKYTPVQIANLLTPVYRAMFQASKAYMGHVHQYDENSAIILFSANDCDDQLYINAICTAKLFQGLIDNLMKLDIYSDTPTVDYKICIDKAIPEARDKIKTDEFRLAVRKTKKLMETLDTRSIALTEEVFNLPEMNNRVFTSLPDIFTDEEDGEEILSYCIRYLSKSLSNKVDKQIEKMTEQ